MARRAGAGRAAWVGRTEWDGAQRNEASGSEPSVGAAWVVRGGTERNGTGQDGAQRNKAGGAGGVGQTASGRGEAAT